MNAVFSETIKAKKLVLGMGATTQTPITHMKKWLPEIIKLKSFSNKILCSCI